jgi:hypothetical protein
MAALLEVDAAGDEEATARAMLDRFLNKRGFSDAVSSSQSRPMENTLVLDTAIVFGKAVSDDCGGLSSKL